MPDLESFLALPLFGGLAGLIYAVAKAWTLIRSGTRTQERDAVRERTQWNRSLVRRAQWAEIQLDWWRARAGDLEYVIRRWLGEEHIPPARRYPAQPEGDEDDE